MEAATIVHKGCLYAGRDPGYLSSLVIQWIYKQASKQASLGISDSVSSRLVHASPVSLRNFEKRQLKIGINVSQPWIQRHSWDR